MKRTSDTLKLIALALFWYAALLVLPAAFAEADTLFLSTDTSTENSWPSGGLEVIGFYFNISEYPTCADLPDWEVTYMELYGRQNAGSNSYQIAFVVWNGSTMASVATSSTASLSGSNSFNPFSIH